ncbi:hypothetical protein CBR_g3089 [Chara braunii]|uniref:Uncharacterized protein n=1 Tax=Chara braunii TaxID=69332 RepID=A0A388KEQ4_CHABU|nr:hypothetical protein CBR_g3089 [Chara braunii]|eukprot:GBG68545.1 hypothetical protein CBR_g3089 [Chara braunii]
MANQTSNGRYIPPTPSATTRANDRLREAVGRCYAQGECPDDASLGEVIEDAEGKRFVVDGRVNAVKEEWLKDHTVIITFLGEARNLSRQIKEDLIRAYEDGWFAKKLFGASAERGRVKFEGANVASYVARSEQIATWLLQQRELKIKLQETEEYVVSFKPWLPLQELKEMKLQEAELKFWIIALRVPLDAYFYLRSAVQGVFGEVIEMHPPEYDRSRPRLMNVKLEMSPKVRGKIDDVLIIESPAGEKWRVEIASPYTNWCRRCRWYFHTEANCLRTRQGEEKGANAAVRSGGHKVRFFRHQQRQEQQVRNHSASRSVRGEAVEAQQDVADWATSGTNSDNHGGRCNEPEQTAERPAPHGELSKTSNSSNSRVRWGSEWYEGEKRSQRSEGECSSMLSSAASKSPRKGEALRGEVASSFQDRRADTVDRSQAEKVQRRLVPILCTMANDGVYFLALAQADGAPTLPSVDVDHSPTPSEIAEFTRSLYGQHVPIRLIPRSTMVSLIVESGGRFYKLYFPLLDARIPSELATPLTQAGVRWIHMFRLSDRFTEELELIKILPDISTLILRNVNKKLQKDEDLLSPFLAKALTADWQVLSESNSSRGSSRDRSRSSRRSRGTRASEAEGDSPLPLEVVQSHSRIQDQTGTVGLDGQA